MVKITGKPPRPVLFHRQKWIEWWPHRHGKPGRPKGDYDADLDILGADKSPALERLRNLTADLKQLELEQKRGNLVQVNDIKRSMTEVARLLRECGDGARRRFGNEIGDYLCDGISQAVDAGKRLLLMDDDA